jgi:hypothetical protein
MKCEEIATQRCRCSRTAVYRCRVVRGQYGEGGRCLFASYPTHTVKSKRKPKYRIPTEPKTKNKRRAG